jgi:hypothetical protein
MAQAGALEAVGLRVGRWAYPFASATTSKRPSGSSRTTQLNDSERLSSFSCFALRRARAASSVVIG